MNRESPPAEARPIRVYVLLALGLISFTSSSILIRYASDAPGLSVAAWRTMLGAVLLWPFAYRVREEFRALTRRDWGFIAGAGVLLSLHFIAFIESIYLTSVASAAVLVTTTPLFLAILSIVVFRQKLGGFVWAGVIVGVGGAVLIGLGDVGAQLPAPRPWLGNGLALGGALVMCFYMLIGRAVRQRVSWLAYVLPLYTIVGATCALAALLMGAPLFGLPAHVYGLCLLMALGPQLLGHGSLNYALRYFSAVLLSLLTLLEPVGSSIAAFFLFGEQPGPVALIGMVLTLSGVSFALLGERRERLFHLSKNGVELLRRKLREPR